MNYSEDAEIGALGAMLCDPGAAQIAKEDLVAEDFYLGKHHIIFNALCHVFKTGATLDEILVCDELIRHNVLEQAGGREYIGRLIVKTGTAANVEDYCRIVKEHSIKRQTMEAGLKIAKSGSLNEAQSLIASIAEKKTEHVNDAPTLFDLLCRPQDLVPLPRISSGFITIDKLLNGGFVAGGMYPIAGSVSKGKSTFAVNIGRAMATTGAGVIITTLEDTTAQVVRKLVAQTSRLSYTAIEQHYIACVEPDKGCFRPEAQAAAEMLGTLPIKIEGEKANIDDQEALVENLASKGFSVFILDQSSWVQIPETEDEITRANECARRLKLLAKRLNIVVIPLVQVNRSGGAAARDGGDIELYHMKSASKWEEDADGVMIIQSLDNTQNPSPMRIDMKKNRHGIRDIGAYMMAYLEYGLIEDGADTEPRRVAELKALGVTTAQVKNAIPKQEKQKAVRMTLREYVDTVCGVKPLARDILIQNTIDLGQTVAHAQYLFKLAENNGEIFLYKFPGNSLRYSTVKPDTE